MADVLRIIVMRSLDTVITESLAKHNVPSRSPSLASLGSPDLRGLDEIHNAGATVGVAAVSDDHARDSLHLRRNSMASPVSAPEDQPFSRTSSTSASGSVSASSSPRESQEDDLGLGFQLVDARDAGAPIQVANAQSSAVDTRFEAMIQLRNNELAQSQYQDLFIKHLLLHKTEEHDDMLFYVPLSWPAAMRRDALSGIGPPSTPTYSTSSSDLLIVQRNVASTLSLPPSLPDVDWTMSVWLNVIMQHTYTAEVSVNLSHSARLLRSYPVFANPYRIDTESNVVACSFPFIYFTLGENHGTLANDSKLFLSLTTQVKPRGPGAPAQRRIAEITLSHSKCLDQLRRARRGKTSDAQGAAVGGVFTFLVPFGRKPKRPREYVIVCSRGISQIALQRSSASSHTIEYTIQTVRIHILDVIAQLLR